MCNAAPCPPSTCRCREPLVDQARPRTCYECGLPVAATVRCPRCAGIGRLWREVLMIQTTCPRCKGAGLVPREEQS